MKEPITTSRLNVSIVWLSLMCAMCYCAVIAYTKIQLLKMFHYTSDCVMYDQILTNILRGNWFLEYTYGNQLGDHSYLFLLLLVPIKALAGGLMLNFLIVLTPLFNAAFVCIIGYIGFCAIISTLFMFLGTLGQLELVYGFHPDTISGYLLAICALLLAESESQFRRLPRRWFTAGAMLSYGIFMTLKEEMMLLGAMFFLILFVLRRERGSFLLFFLSSVTFTMALSVISRNSTSFNRTNAALLTSFLNLIRKPSFNFFEYIPVSFYATFLVFIILFAMSVLSFRRISAHALALLLVGLTKASTAVLSEDFNLTTWHNFPAVVMCTSAILLQWFYGTEVDQPRSSVWMPVISSALSALLYLSIDFQTLVSINKVNRKISSQIALRKSDIEQIKKTIPTHHVVAIDGHIAVAMTEYRTTFFPRGVWKSPEGIADFVLITLREFIDKRERFRGEFFLKKGEVLCTSKA